VIIATAIYLYTRYNSAAKPEPDAIEEDLTLNFFGLLNSGKSPRRQSAVVNFGEQYATGIFNDQGKLRTEENPTNARLTLSMNQSSRNTNFIDDRSVEAGMGNDLKI